LRISEINKGYKDSFKLKLVKGLQRIILLRTWSCSGIVFGFVLRTRP